MIVFTIVWGERYIKNFFERCLPSLMGPGGIPSLKDEKIRLMIYTIQSDHQLIKSYLSKEEARFFRKQGDVEVLSRAAIKLDTGQPDAKDMPGEPAIRVGGRRLFAFLLESAILEIAKRGEVFFFAVPDLVYSDGTLQSCYELHRLTGRTIAIFNGRTAPKPGQPLSTAEELLRISRAPHDLVDFFFENMNSNWRSWFTSDLDRIPGHYPGHMVFQSDNTRVIFCPFPNPVLGKFTMADAAWFVVYPSSKTWDHVWASKLIRNNQLLVQTNLDAAMSIEPEAPDDGDGNDAKNVSEAGSSVYFDMFMGGVGELAADTRRKIQFDGAETFCFTTSGRSVGRTPTA